MADDVLLERFSHKVHELFRFNSGGMRFKVKGAAANFWLVEKKEPYTELYRITIGPECCIKNLSSNKENTVITQNIINNNSFTEFWISYYNEKIQFGNTGQSAPTLEFNCLDESTYLDHVGYIKFNSPSTRFSDTTWIIEAPPIIYNSPPTVRKHIDGGEMYWTPMDSTQLPQDAFIGGLENEPTYIARAFHNRSLCPGRYVSSRHAAFIPWGFREHQKNDFEILCGFDAEWVKTKGDDIPQNAIVAGYSEVQHEPLYIGRAMHRGYLLTGKVHVLYKSCYLPFRGREVAVTAYEILVYADGKRHTIYDQEE